MTFVPAFQIAQAQTLTNYLFALYLEGEEEAKRIELQMKRSVVAYRTARIKLGDT